MLAGRDREAGALREAWDRAVAGDSGLVMIVGEAGIGKTALAEDLAADVDTDGAMVLRTRCYEAERSLFLQPVAEAVTPIVSRMPASGLRQLLGEHAPALAALLPEAAANCTFAGPDGRTLFITATSTLWSIEVGIRGDVTPWADERASGR